MKFGDGRSDGEDACGHRDGDGEQVVDQDRGTGDQCRIDAKVLACDDVRSPVHRVGLHRLAVARDDDEHQEGNRAGDGEDETG
jgi:hypothetical protein